MIWYFLIRKQAEAEKLPPTRCTLEQIILRSHYIAIIWCNDTVSLPDLPPPTDFGCKLENGAYMASPSTLPQLQKSSRIREMQLLQEPMADNSRCSCRSNNLKCTEMCGCGAEETNCANCLIDDDVHEPSSDSDEELLF